MSRARFRVRVSALLPVLVLVLVLIVMTLGCGSSGARASDGSVTLNVALRGAHYRLPNGLEVMLHPDRTFRNVAVNVRYHVGGKDDPPKLSGLAHLYEHLMFLGSKHIPPGGFSKALDDAAVLSYNAFTSQDETEYYEVMPSSQVPIALWLEADRMRYPIDRVDEEAFRRERDVVKNEWRERYDNKPYGHVQGFVHGAIFPAGHPYHRLPIGSVEDLDRASLAEARAFATRYYVPSNATLVVVGDFDLAEVKPIVDTLFSPIPGGTPPAVRAFEPVRLDKDRRVEVEADVESPLVMVAWPIPPPSARGWYEMHFAASRIAGMTSYKLEVEKKTSRHVGWNIIPGRLGSILQIEVQLEPKESVDEAVDAIDARVKWTAKMERERGYDWPELPHARTLRMTSSVLALGNIIDRASRIEEYLEYFGDADSAQSELRRIQAVTALETAIATEELLMDQGRVVVAVTPRRGAPRSGRVVR